MDDKDKDELPCVEKAVYETKEQAEAIALTADWQRGIALKVYKCRHCGLWHLTSS